MTDRLEAAIAAASARYAAELVAALRVELVAERQLITDAPDRLYGIDSAAELLGVGRSFAYDEIGRGRLRSVKAGRRRLIPATAISDYIAERGQ